MAVVEFFIALVVIAVTWYQLKNYRRNQHLAKIPVMKGGLPLIGNILSFVGKTPAQIYKNLEKASVDHGPIWRFDLAIQTNVMVHDPKLVEGILSSQKMLEKSAEYDSIRKWLGDGLLLSTGKKWHQRRKIITPSFHFKILENFTEVFNDQGKVFVEILEAFEGQHVDFFPLVSLYALDVICQSAMGCEINAQKNSDSEYVRAVKEITKIFFLKAFDTAKRIPFLYQFSEMQKLETKTLKVLHGFTNSVIESRRKELAAKLSTKSGKEDEDIGIKKKTAFLDLLLQSTIDGEPLTNEDIREEVDTFMFEGHDTTTSGISFILYNLAMNPDIQKKVYEEARSVVSVDLTTPLTMQKLNSLNYLELVIKETLRLYPSVPLYGRKISADIIIGDFTVPKGTGLIVAPLYLGRDPKIFPDPLKFDPTRFDVETNNEKNNAFSYVPFSAGPRNCIGQKFAMLEMKSIVAKIILNYDLSITKENAELTLISELILRPENGIVLGVRKRV